MTGVKAWNGSAWVNPKFKNNSGWVGYDPGGLAYPYDWNNLVWDPMGWHGSTSDDIPAYHSPGAGWVIQGTGYNYVYSPDLDAPPIVKGQNYFGQVLAYCAQPGSQGSEFRVNLYMHEWLDAVSVGHNFTVPGEAVWLTTPHITAANYLSGFQCYTQDDNEIIYVQAAKILNADGSPVGEQKPPRNVAFFDGNMWVYQNAL